MLRVWVVGNSGSGKSTTARRLAERIGVPWTELDAIYHLPGWTELDTEQFRRTVAQVVAGDTWVVDGNYSAVADEVRARADTVVWLDLPRSEVMRQIVRRTLTRLARRETLWNGNRESWRNLLRRDPEASIIRWAWTQHGKYTERYAALSADLKGTPTTVVRLRSRDEVDRFVASVQRSPDKDGQHQQP